MIHIDYYTATWDDAVRQRTKLRAGMLCGVHQSCDARELDAFVRRLREKNYDLDWVTWKPRLSMNVFKIIRVSKDS